MYILASRLGAIIKESRRELINSKLEKGTPRLEPDPLYPLARPFLFFGFLFSSHFFFSLTDGTRENFLIYTAQRLSQRIS
jgi:hypothetical protein